MHTRGVKEKSLERHLEAFLEELELHRYSDSLKSRARRVLSLLFRHLRARGLQDIRAVSEKHLMSFGRRLQKLETCRGTKLAANSRYAYLSVVKRFFTFLDKRSVILKNPASQIRLRCPQRLPRNVLSRTQVSELLETPSATTPLGIRDRAILETFYGTAVRLSECIRLDISDVDLQGTELWVRDGKGKKDRLLPIPRRAVQAMELYVKDSRPRLVHNPNEKAFFLSLHGRRVSKSLIHRMLKNCGKWAGIPHRVHPHSLRHACATHLLQEGADIRHIQELLGHQFIETTAAYTKVQVEDLRKVLAKAHPRERGRSRVISSSPRTENVMKRNSGAEGDQ